MSIYVKAFLIKGALVFLAVFFVALVLTVSTPWIPPGLSIYFALVFPRLIIRYSESLLRPLPRQSSTE